jgi:hypothetical protein
VAETDPIRAPLGVTSGARTAQDWGALGPAASTSYCKPPCAMTARALRRRPHCNGAWKGAQPARAGRRRAGRRATRLWTRATALPSLALGRVATAGCSSRYLSRSRCWGHWCRRAPPAPAWTLPPGASLRKAGLAAHYRFAAAGGLGAQGPALLGWRLASTQQTQLASGGPEDGGTQVCAEAQVFPDGVRMTQGVVEDATGAVLGAPDQRKVAGDSSIGRRNAARIH